MYVPALLSAAVVEKIKYSVNCVSSWNYKQQNINLLAPEF